MNEFKRIQNDIAASLYISPCTEAELIKRNFLKNTSFYGIQRCIQMLENQGAIYYRGEIMHTYKNWGRKNLQDYELDFRSDRQKEIDGMTKFKREFLGL